MLDSFPENEGFFVFFLGFWTRWDLFFFILWLASASRTNDCSDSTVMIPKYNMYMYVKPVWTFVKIFRHDAIKFFVFNIDESRPIKLLSAMLLLFFFLFLCCYQYSYGSLKACFCFFFFFFYGPENELPIVAADGTKIKGQKKAYLKNLSNLRPTPQTSSGYCCPGRCQNMAQTRSSWTLLPPQSLDGELGKSEQLEP